MLPAKARLENPFLALRPYTGTQRDRFFGRDSDLTLTKSRLFSARTTLLFAGSGVGKTSFIDALLVPALEGDWRIVTHRRWTGRPPLDGVCESVAAALHAAVPAREGGLAKAVTAELALKDDQADKEPRPHRFLLILDQFEEVFQHWRDTRAMVAFARALMLLLAGTRESADVRILISMREEFLGELSLFDNLIPDLFGNIYRLKNLTRDQAETVIEHTVRWAGGSCGAGTEGLLDDLMKMRGRPAGGAAVPEADLAEGDRIRPPILQIACHRLWAAQMTGGETQFLKAYHAGTAQDELAAYCREKIERGFDAEQKDIASDAFNFLITKRGAKMPYELDHLAEHAAWPKVKLGVVLDRLSEDGVRILRKTDGDGNASPWYELYHDMYAPFLFEWKREHDDARKREEAARLKREAAADEERKQKRERWVSRFLTIAIILTILLVPLYLDYRVVAKFLEHPFTEAGGKYEEAAASKEKLGFLFASDWSHMWRTRATAEAASGKWDDAVLGMLQAVRQEASGNEFDRRLLGAWTNDAYSQLLRSFPIEGSQAVRVVSTTTDGRVLVGFAGGGIRAWNRATAVPFASRPGEMLRVVEEGASQAATETALPPTQGGVARTSSPRSAEEIDPVKFSLDGRHVLGRLSQAQSQVQGQGVYALFSLAPDTLGAKFIRGVEAKSHYGFSPDGKWVALATDGSVLLVGVGGELREIRHAGAMNVAFSEAGDRVAVVGKDLRVAVWSIDGTTKPWERTLAPPTPGSSPGDWMSPVLLFAGPDRVLVGVAPRTRPGGSTPWRGLTVLSLLDRAREGIVWKRQLPPNSSVQKAKNGMVFQISSTGVVGIELADGKDSGLPLTIPRSGVDRFTAAPVLTPEGTLLIHARSPYSRVREWKLEPIRRERWAPAAAGEILKAVSGDGRWLVSALSSSDGLRSAGGATERKPLPQELNGGNYEFREDSAALLAYRKGDDADTAQPAVAVVMLPAAEVRSLPQGALPAGLVSLRAIWSKGNRVLIFTKAATATGGAECLLWDSAQAGQLLSRFQDCEDLALSDDGRLAAVRSARSGIRLYRPEGASNWTDAGVLPNSGRMAKLLVSADGGNVAGVESSSISVWSVAERDRAPVVIQAPNDEEINAAVFGPQAGQVTAVLAESGLRVWLLANPSSPVLSIALGDSAERLESRSGKVVAVTQRSIHVLQPGASGQLNAYVRPLPFPLTFEASWATLTPDGVGYAGAMPGGWRIGVVRYDLEDAAPFTKPADKTWDEVIAEWNLRLGRRIGTGGRAVAN